jgi:uncharacterized protein YjdB
MASFKIYWKAATKQVKVVRNGDAAPGGYTFLNTFAHDNANDAVGATGSHVMYHHIRDELYKIGQLDMSIIDIADIDSIINVTAISIAPATAALAPEDTQQLTVTFTPVAPDNVAVTYTSADEEIATVDEDGLITAVADGVVTITATSVDGSFTDTCVVTVATP